MLRYVTISAVGLLLSMPAAGHGEAIAIVGGTLIDGTGTGPVEDSAVVIEHGRVVYAGTRADASIPEGSKAIDAGGKFLVPGLADMHNHLADGTFELGRPSSNAAKNLRCLLARGITTVFNPGVDVNTFVELKRLARENPSEYPHFFGTGPSFAREGGHGSRLGNTPVGTQAARTRVRDLKAAGVDAIKLHYTDLTYVSRQPQPMLRREILAAVIDEAHRQGLKAYVHAPILQYAKQALEAGADGLVHGIVSDPIDAELVTLMKRNSAVLLTTHSIFYAAADLGAWAQRLAAFERSELIPRAMIQAGMQPDRVTAWEQRFDNLARLREQLAVLRDNTKALADAGLLVVAGSDTSNSGTGTFLGLCSLVELDLLAEAGIPPDQIVQMTTLNAARMIGRDEEMGSLEAGKLADLVILDEDPLADIKNVRSIHAIVKFGRVYSPDEFSGCVLDEAGPGADVSRRRELRSTALVSHSRAVIDETIPASQTNSWLTEVPNE